MISESEPRAPDPRPPAHQRGTDGEDLILAALDFLRGSLSANGGAYGSPTLAWQKENLYQWADRLGLLLDISDLPAKVVRGGQEHELFHDEVADRYFKITCNGVFGLSPGIELALVYLPSLRKLWLPDTASAPCGQSPLEADCEHFTLTIKLLLE